MNLLSFLTDSIASSDRNLIRSAQPHIMVLGFLSGMTVKNLRAREVETYAGMTLRTFETLSWPSVSLRRHYPEQVIRVSLSHAHVERGTPNRKIFNVTFVTLSDYRKKQRQSH